MLLEREAITRAKEVGLAPHHFYRDIHMRLCTLLYDLHERSVPVDLVTFGEELRQRGVLDELGGMPYLLHLQESAPSSAAIAHYASIVMALAARRGAIVLARDLTDAAYDTSRSLPEVWESHRSQAQALASNGRLKGPVVLTHGQILAEPPPGMDWICRPFFAAKTLAFLAGREGVGKSWKAMYYAICLAAGRPLYDAESRQGGLLLPVERPERVLFLDLQNSSEMLRNRYWAVCRGLWPKEDWPDLDIEFRCEMRMRANEPAGLDDLRRMTAGGHFGVVFIDSFRYLQGCDENSSQEMESVLTPLRLLTYETGSQILVIHHEGKGMIEGGRPRPARDTLRGSTEIAAAAHTVIRVTDEGNSGLSLQHVKSNIARKFPMLLVDMEGDSNEGEPIVFRFVGEATSRLGAYEVGLRQVEAILMVEGGRLRSRALQGRAWAEHQIRYDALKEMLRKGLGEGRLVRVEHSRKNVEWSLPGFEEETQRANEVGS